MTRLSLRSLASFLRCLTLYVGNDTGTLHLAAGLGVPTVGLFGPTDPAIWAPLSPRGIALRGSDEKTAGLSVAQVESAVVERLAALYSESS
jgi:ADP-heptose:LPS heptosyltransferase